MPVIDRRNNVTGLPDDVIRSLVGDRRSVVQAWRNPYLDRVRASGVDRSRVTNPTQNAGRVVSGLFPELYRPGGLLYRP